MVKQSRENFLGIREDKRIVLYGAGEFAMRFMNYYGDGSNVVYICDKDKRKWGHRIYGVEIVSPERLSQEDPQEVVIVVTSGSYDSVVSIINGLKEKDKEYKIFNAYILMNDLFENIASTLYDNQDKIMQVENMLYDEPSKHIYREVIRRRMEYGECDFSDLVIPGDVEYRIPMMFEHSRACDEVIIDCGAYNGDTLRAFTNTFGDKLAKVYAFECANIQLQQLKELAGKMQTRKYCPEIVVMPYGVSDKEEKLSLVATPKPYGSFIGDNRKIVRNAFYDSDNYTIETVSLDNVIPVDEKVTFIKMDIEGSEFRALKGARRIITQYKPKLAISLYHLGEDYYRIPLLVKEMVPEYKIVIRHHKKRHVDTDMYCFL